MVESYFEWTSTKENTFRKVIRGVTYDDDAAVSAPEVLEEDREEYAEFIRKIEGAYELLYHSEHRNYDWIKFKFGIGHRGFVKEFEWKPFELQQLCVSDLREFDILPVSWHKEIIYRFSRDMLANEHKWRSKGHLARAYAHLAEVGERLNVINLPHDLHPRNFVGEFGKDLGLYLYTRSIDGSVSTQCIIRDVHGTLSQEDGDTLNGKPVDMQYILSIRKRTRDATRYELPDDYAEEEE
jgi:hypothetical protein